MKRITVLIVDDHPVFLEGLKMVLSLKDSEIEIVGTALNGQEALERDEDLDPDVVLMDIKMPVMDGVTLARHLLARRRNLKIIMLTTFDDRQLIQDALEAGAKGYLLKGSKPETIIDSIKYVSGDNVVLSGDLALKLSSASPPPPLSPTDKGFVEAAVQELSARELEILHMVAQGNRNPQIAEELGISEKTVRNYVTRIYDVLDMHSRTEVAIWAIRNLEGDR